VNPAFKPAPPLTFRKLGSIRARVDQLRCPMTGLIESNVSQNLFHIANRTPRPRGRTPGALSHMVAANLRARALAPIVRDIWASGFMSYNAVSRELNRRGVPPFQGGKQWYPMTAGRLLVRLERTGQIRIRRPASRGSLLDLALNNSAAGRKAKKTS
jgi:hypothetical protein